MKKVVNYIKNEIILIIAMIMAIGSAFLVPPGKEYLSYIDYRVLGILLSLMLVMEGFQQLGVFSYIGDRLLRKTRTVRQLVMVLILLCFFSSMLITNDVALITFVPFTILVLRQANKERLLISVIVLQTLAANLGSMLTPIGNPQNLYLYNISQMDLLTFCSILLPYTMCALLLLLVCILAFPHQNIQVGYRIQQRNSDKLEEIPGKPFAFFFVLFLLCMLVVVRVLPWYLVLVIVVVTVAIYDYQIVEKADYGLLLTFIAFFIFIGNVEQLDVVQSTLRQLVNGQEMWIGIITSQFISNVPAALLLSGFTDSYVELLKGVNLGGMGTLIASMASLISYKLFANQYPRHRLRYLFVFTIANVGFLLVMTGVDKLFG